MNNAGHTPPFLGPDGAPVAGSIAEVHYMRLGGVDQWVMIRGENIANPPLVLLHGGPGMSETTFFRACNASLEKSFTVVYWDQRGAGRSFDAAIPRSSMNAAQFVSDLGELVDTVRRLLGQDKVALFGHSWGSLFGVLYAAQFPEKVAAYVGSGQVGDWQAAESASYAFALDLARRRGRAKAIRALTGIGPPPYSSRSLLTERTWVQRLAGQVGPRAFWNTARLMARAPETSLRDLPDLWRGFSFSLDAMWGDVSKMSLLNLAPALRVPVFFFLGRRDRWVPPETSVAYFDALVAPSKRLVWFEESAHEPFVDEPAKFNALMVELVRPVCVSPAPRSDTNTRVVRRIFDAVNAHDVPGILDHYAPDYALHGAPAGVSPDLAGARQMFSALFAAFPDAHATVEELIAQDDKVVSRITFRGTHTGPLGGIPPTGRRVAVSEVYVTRFRDARCVEEWRLMDELGLLQQLGALGRPGSVAA